MMDHTRRTWIRILGEGGEGRALSIAAKAGHAGGAAHGAARVSVPHHVAAALVVVLVVQDHFAEHQKIFGGPTTFWRRGLKIIIENANKFYMILLKILQ